MSAWRRSLLALALVVFVAAASPAGAGLLWYNGDGDRFDALSNERNTLVSLSNLYDNFFVTDASGWTLNELFSNNALEPGVAFPLADYTIRSGVSLGNGGTVVASGSNLPVSIALVEANYAGFGLDLHRFTISGVNIFLPPGEYWLNVTPVGSVAGIGRSFLATTSGANAAGTPPGNDGRSFWFSAPDAFDQDFADPAPAISLAAADFSQGVAGVVAVPAAVPEPGTAALTGLGLLGLIGWRRRAGRGWRQS